MGNLVWIKNKPSPPRRFRRARRVPYALAVALCGLFAAAYLGLAAEGPGVDVGKPLGVPSIDSPRGTLATASFRMCGRPPHYDCVIDGDTFYYGGDSIRIADIDTPETNQPQCAAELAPGTEATNRLLVLLNRGPFSLERWPGRDEDQYGRKLRTVVRDGHSLGDVLVAEGLAREWTGRRMPWCA